MIGIFDSGVGGMTVARAVEQRLPGLPLLYFGDIARAPYGPKSRETIIAYAVENTAFLVERGARLVIVACNSAASCAVEELRRRFDLPIIEVIGPAIRRAVALSRGRIGVIGTRATVRSGVYERGIRALSAHQVVSRACPLLVPLVEEGWIHRRETKMILRRYLHPLRERQVDTLVLGCTHYPLLAHLIQPRIGRRVRLIDSGAEAARALEAFLDQEPGLARDLRGPGTSSFHVSDITEPALAMSRRIFGRPVQLHKVTP